MGTLRNYRMLQDHGFFGKYFDLTAGHQQRLVQVAKDSYGFLKKMGNTSPLPQELEAFLEIDLSISSAFTELVVALCGQSTPQPHDKFWQEDFLPVAACFLVDNEWDDIVSC